ILTVSRATADRLEVHGIGRNRMVVIPHGLTPLPAPAPLEAIDARLVTGPYVLAVGETSPRKGYMTLLRAFARMHLDNLNLVIAGPDAGDEQRIQNAITELGLERKVIRLRAVNDHALAGLYRRA